MRTFSFFLLVISLLTSCESKANVNRGYVISKSPLENETGCSYEEQEEIMQDSP